MADFVQDSKLGRRLVTVDMRLAAVSAARAAHREAPALAAFSAYGASAVVALMCALWWGTPLAALPSGWFSPLGWVLALGAGARGLLGVLPWAALCSLLAERGLTALALATGVLSPQPAVTLWSMVFGR